MSYRCELCAAIVPPQHQRRIVAVKRPCTYRNGSNGEEIVREYSVCGPCYTSHQQGDTLSELLERGATARTEHVPHTTVIETWEVLIQGVKPLPQRVIL